MTSEKILKYNEVLDSMEKNGQPRTLLLGNGFSLAYDPNGFNFESLRKIAESSGQCKYPILFQVFDAFKSNDFEKILELLDNCKTINRLVCKDSDLSDIEQYQRQIKTLFIDAISKINPLHAGTLTIDQYNSAKAFLKNYDSIYTLNYDLLLYWVLLDLINKSEESSRLRVNDGFRRNPQDEESLCQYQQGSECSIHYLHGALHLWNDSSYTYKIHRRENNLLDEIQQNITKNFFPLFVSEGTSVAKLNKIYQQPYLRETYLSLEQIQGNIVIFGTILKENDAHICQAILKSNCSHIFIGIYDNPVDLDGVQAFQRKLNDKNKQVLYFDSRAMNIWGN